MDIAAFISDWHLASGGEPRAREYFLDLCAALGVPPPDVGQDRYAFEADVLEVHEGGTTTVLRVDLYKHGCFILVARQGSNPGDAKPGHGERDGEAWKRSMQSAYGQAVGHARSMEEPPLFVVVCDVGYLFELYADFDRSGFYRPFPNAQKHRRFVVDLEVHAKDLRALFLDPRSLDPARIGLKVTRDIAEDLAQIARLLEGKGHAPALVARFLMRCMFTMFAESVDLLPEAMFTRQLQRSWTSLFEDPVALPLEEKGLEILRRVAEREWADVEPSIFGTLLERALDPRERHRLGAHFTPRAHVERLVRPTIELPLRIAWENAQASSFKLRAEGKLEAAREIVHAFHRRLCATRVLDPACGSGNFLYVTLDILKQIESEALAALVDLGEKEEPLIRITPGNFRGIEVSPWGKEIAELVLWIGYLQWHYRSHGKGMPPPSPALQDHGNIECRDAVLAWDEIELVRDAEGAPVTRWDGETHKKNPLTGEMIPDDKAVVTVERYVNPRKTEWPQADYVIGNPPFIGTRRMRLILGDGYVEALTVAMPEVADTADYVMYWWDKAAELARTGKITQFGLITTNSISQSFNRTVVRRHLTAKPPLRLAFAVADHPWVESSDGAAVRVAMTVGASGEGSGTLLTTEAESVDADGDQEVKLSAPQVGSIFEDLRVGASPAQAVPLLANRRIAYWGVKFYGDGFIVSMDEATSLARQQGFASLAKQFVSGRDLTGAPRLLWALDCDGLDEGALRSGYPATHRHLLERVKPVREHNSRAFKRERWWIFGENQPGMRESVKGLARCFATAETSKHRVFHALDTNTVAEGTVAVVALDDAFFLGVLSSRAHVVWALAAGGRLGIGNDPRYNKTRCFDPFAFPVCDEVRKERVRALAEDLSAHRKARQAAHPDLTITGMYNVLEKLRASTELTDSDRAVNTRALVSVLAKIHDDLDAAVFEAYGWSVDLTDEQILEKLVALNAERAREEEKGLVRWLRPDFQNPSGKKPEAQADRPTGEDEEDPRSAPTPMAIKPWPKKIAEQIAAVRDRVAFPGKLFTVESVAGAFKGARKKDIEGFLDGFAALGVLTVVEVPSGKRWRAAGRSA